MFGLSLDEQNDLILQGGSFKRTSEGAYVAQMVKTMLQTVEGEIESDPTLGIPYFTEIFIKPVNLAQVAATFKAKILAVAGVDSLLDFDFDYNEKTRQFTLDFSVNTTWGEIVIEDVTVGGL